jgi:hypothetical protein
MSSSGWGNGRVLSSIASTTAKIAVLPPIPIANVSTMAAVESGVRHNARTQYLKSIVDKGVSGWH